MNIENLFLGNFFAGQCNKYKNNPNNRNFTEYKNYRKFVRSNITSCKINLEKRKFMSKNTTSKPFLDYINSCKSVPYQSNCYS